MNVNPVRTLSPQRKKTSMLRNAARALVLGLVATIAFGLLGPQAAAHAAAKDDNPPTEDCIAMATLVLGGLAIRAGAAAYTVGNGAIYANSSSVIGNITGVVSSYNCATYLVPRYINKICKQSRQALRYKKTWEARALVSFATSNRKTRC